MLTLYQFISTWRNYTKEHYAIRIGNVWYIEDAKLIPNRARVQIIPRTYPLSSIMQNPILVTLYDVVLLADERCDYQLTFARTYWVKLKTLRYVLQTYVDKTLRNYSFMIGPHALHNDEMYVDNSNPIIVTAPFSVEDRATLQDKILYVTDLRYTLVDLTGRTYTFPFSQVNLLTLAQLRELLLTVYNLHSAHYDIWMDDLLLTDPHLYIPIDATLTISPPLTEQYAYIIYDLRHKREHNIRTHSNVNFMHILQALDLTTDAQNEQLLAFQKDRILNYTDPTALYINEIIYITWPRGDDRNGYRAYTIKTAIGMFRIPIDTVLTLSELLRELRTRWNFDTDALQLYTESDAADVLYFTNLHEYIAEHRNLYMSYFDVQPQLDANKSMTRESLARLHVMEKLHAIGAVVHTIAPGNQPIELTEAEIEDRRDRGDFYLRPYITPNNNASSSTILQYNLQSQTDVTINYTVTWFSEQLTYQCTCIDYKIYLHNTSYKCIHIWAVSYKYERLHDLKTSTTKIEYIIKTESGDEQIFERPYELYGSTELYEDIVALGYMPADYIPMYKGHRLLFLPEVIPAGSTIIMKRRNTNVEFR